MVKASKKTILPSEEHVEGIYMKGAGVIDKATKSETGKAIGGWLFVIGFVIAIIAGLWAGIAATGSAGAMDASTAGLLTAVLVIIGLIVGLVNIQTDEATTFLIGAIAICVAGAAMTSAGISWSTMATAASGLGVLEVSINVVAAFLGGLMQMVSYFVAPAALIVGLKVVYKSARKA